MQGNSQVQGSLHFLDGDVVLLRIYAGVELNTLGVRIGCPDKEAQTLDEGSIVGTVTPDDRVARQDAEVLPPNGRQTVILVHSDLAVPELGQDDLAQVIDDSQTFNVATALVLANVDV